MRQRRNEGKNAQETSMLVLLLKWKLCREVGFCFGGKKPLRINIRTKSTSGTVCSCAYRRFTAWEPNLTLRIIVGFDLSRGKFEAGESEHW
jgi:hypothetical protein